MHIDFRIPVKIKKSFVLFFIIFIMSSCGGGGGGGSSSGTDDGDNKTLTAINVTPVNPGIFTNATQQFTATGTYSDDSTADISQSVSWTSSATGVATINSSGLATPLAAGTTVITASYSGFSGTANLTVEDTAFSLSTIDNSTNDVGMYTSIATGSIHVTYYDATSGELKYISNDSGTWTSPVTIDNIGIELGLDTTITSVKLHDSSNVRIAYYDYTNEDLKYAECSAACTNPDNWTTVTVDSTGSTGSDVSLDIDSSGRPHISYYDESNLDIKYATCSTGCTQAENWENTAIQSTGDIGQYSSISVDPDNNVHISYYDSTEGVISGDLIYATCSSNCTSNNNWNFVTLDSKGDVGIHSSIASTSEGVHISYYNFESNTELRYATCSSSCTQADNWNITAIDSASDVGEYSSIALDSGNNVHISYYDYFNENLKYATNASGSWATYTVDDTAEVGEFTSIAVDSDDKVHISYYDFTNKDLKYAVK